jgi:hypothetical protein
MKTKYEQNKFPSNTVSSSLLGCEARKPIHMGEGFRSEPSLKRLDPLYFGVTIVPYLGALNA